MLALFKGELTLEDILENIPKKRLIVLRDVRIDRLTREQKMMEEQQKQIESQNIQASIMKG